MRKLIHFLWVCLLSSGSLFAQTFGDISGEVRDPSGAVIAGVTVTLTNVATNATRTTESNDQGIYVFPALQPGEYVLKAEKAGFKTFTRSGIRVEVQLSARINIELQVGSVSESIEVRDQAALLQSENATVGTVIDNKRILDLPLAGRNAFNLVALAPNVSFGFPAAGQAGARQGGIRADQSISVSGQRAQFNRYTLDGVENTDPNFNTFVVLPSVDALQEFKVQSGIYPAEFGRGATQINMSTKSGTNEYHGTLFYFLRNEKLDAKNYAFTAARPPKDPFKWNQFGFTLGGPISIPKIVNGKNRMFFMTNYEWFRQRRNVQAVNSVPTAAMQAGNFADVLTTTNPILRTEGIFDPRSRVPGSNVATPFPNAVIPASRIHPISRQLLEFLPTPNLNTPDLRNNFVQAQGRPINRDQFIGRFDVVESPKSQWAGRYSWGDENQTVEQLKLNGDTVVSNFKQVMVSNTRVISTSMVNEARFGYTRFYNTNGPELAFKRDVVGELKIPGLASGPPVQWGIPNVSLQGVYSGFGNSSEGPYEINNGAIQFVNNFSMVRGKHSIKIGGEVRRDRYDQVGNQFARGQFTFTNNATRSLALPGRSGDNFADFLLGETFQAEAAVSIANAKFRATGFALYVDDVWRLSSKLTINFGLRYELTPPWEDQTGTLFNGIVPFDARTTLEAPNVADRSLYPFFMRQGAPRQNCYEGINLRWPDITVRCDGTLGNRLVGLDRNDFAPRLGISWSPNAKWVFRVGAGIFYSQDTGNPRFDMARNLAGRLRDNSRTDIPNLRWENSLASIAGGIANVPRPYTFANPYDRRTPYTQQWMFNIQRELPSNTVLEVGYLGSVSHRLEALRAVNEAIPADPAVDRRAVFERSPFPNFGRIQLVDNGGNGNYHSLASKLTKRYSNGITALVSYTWSKSIDTATAIRNQGGDTLFPQNSYCRHCERARSSHDTRHRMVTSALWDLPFGKGRRVAIENPVANAIAGGWQMSSILTLQTGFPVTVTNGQDASNTGAFFDRPNSTGKNAALPRGQQDPQRFFDTSAFTRNANGTHGNVGRNTLTSPGIIGWDFSMLKNFSLGAESRYAQLRFEWFNFPNHPNWANPNTNIASGGFGQITGTRTNMRQLQVALKLYF
ncbi:MAG: carboxypeptidase-like regulatory domain-containing protein [Bryobacteraceae bacterium]|nr:carboxypeptidase-like regulatory domain-containing protein [Bryobacteraceae bacterium]MDW8378819.1 carboxypeptidase-like regulatory domain-containing protein [Bryobacterales bacterium]